MVPDCTIAGAVSGDIVHLLAELIDNALRYSPPASPVRVSAGFRSDGAVLLQIVDVGLGMTDGDRRIANMRLRAGGEVTPDSARHMGLFVVGRLADRHAIRVRLRGSSVEDARSGSTAEVYLPSTVLASGDGRPDGAARDGIGPGSVRGTARAAGRRARLRCADLAPVEDAGERNGSHSTDSSISLLPRRRPGSSGITGAPDAPPDRDEPPAVELDSGTACSATGFEHVLVLRLAGPIHQRKPPATQSRAGPWPVPVAPNPSCPRPMTSGPPKLLRRRPSRPRTI